MAAKTSPVNAPLPDGFAELDEIAKDPEKMKAFKAKVLAEAKRDNPQLTDAQLESHWAYTEQLFF